MARQLVIVSGGQTGVDRGALDAALEAGAPCHGWCPAGRVAEDGRIPARYPVRELASSDPAERTRRNVEDSDGTLVVDFATSSPGTLLTIEHARRCGKPLMVVQADSAPCGELVDRVMEFVESCSLRVLNIAGPRGSEAPGAEAYTRRLVAGLLARRGQSCQEAASA